MVSKEVSLGKEGHLSKSLGSEGDLPLPPQITEALLALGLRSEQGQALIAGYRLGHPDLSPDKGDLRFTSVQARIALVPAKEA